MTAAVLQWSDLARNPKHIAEVVEREGEARIERRGDAQLILMESRKYDQAQLRLATLTRLLHAMLIHNGASAKAIVYAFPWAAVMPREAREEFFSDYGEMFDACNDLGIWEPLDQLVIEWRATAEIYADPELYRALTRKIDTIEHGGIVPAPEVPDDEAR